MKDLQKQLDEIEWAAQVHKWKLEAEGKTFPSYFKPINKAVISKLLNGTTWNQ